VWPSPIGPVAGWRRHDASLAPSLAPALGQSGRRSLSRGIGISGNRQTLNAAKDRERRQRAGAAASPDGARF
jgi:hypothetical protein